MQKQLLSSSVELLPTVILINILPLLTILAMLPLESLIGHLLMQEMKMVLIK